MVVACLRVILVEFSVFISESTVISAVPCPAAETILVGLSVFTGLIAVEPPMFRMVTGVTIVAIFTGGAIVAIFMSKSRPH